MASASTLFRRKHVLLLAFTSALELQLPSFFISLLQWPSASLKIPSAAQFYLNSTCDVPTLPKNASTPNQIKQTTHLRSN